MLILFINIETGFVYIMDFSLNLISEFYFELLYLLQYSVALVLKNEIDLGPGTEDTIRQNNVPEASGEYCQVWPQPEVGRAGETASCPLPVRAVFLR